MVKLRSSAIEVISLARAAHPVGVGGPQSNPPFELFAKIGALRTRSLREFTCLTDVLMSDHERTVKWPRDTWE